MSLRSSKKVFIPLVLFFGLMLVALSPAVAEHHETEGAHDASAAFEKLKGLAGSWHDAEGSHMHEIQVSAAGTVVQETMGPGTAHEMINMYHVDGDRLLLTHYCAGGNQPQMALQASDKDGTMVFDYIGGTNLDPEVDPHIHAAKIVWVDDDTIESHWTGYQNGKAHHDMVFNLSRKSD